MTKLALSSKAKTLESLSKIENSFSILPIFRFKAIEYIKNSNHIISQIQKQFQDEVIIRSSSENEDNIDSSNAGNFESILNVDINSVDKISNAIEDVIKSFKDNSNDLDEVFIQPMLKYVDIAGVIFTSDIDTLSPYYIINYSENGSTSSVTSGDTNKLKTFVSFKDNKYIRNQKMKNLVSAAKECEDIFQNSALDIEFACFKKKIYIFQVRAIVKNSKNNLSELNLSQGFHKLYKKIKKLNLPHPNLLGDKTIFGVMPDWNPAEIIGVRPKKLALSLYKELITDETWAYQRDNYGYRNLRSHPLLVSFMGMPFIDVRVSFNSFIPKSLENNIAIKLVNYYIDELSKNREYHDKIEFRIIYSCYYFGLENDLAHLENRIFSKIEILKIKNSLLKLTNNIIDVKNGFYKKDLEKINLLENKLFTIQNSNLSIIDKIYWLAKDVKRYGTLPFAGIARASFIAVQFLNSFVTMKIFSEQDKNNFLNSISTVTKELSKDIYKLDKNKFLKKYGHLRPGTYDILSKRYDEDYEKYFGIKKDKNIKDSEIDYFQFTQLQIDKINNLIVKSSLDISFENLILFIKEAIEGREFSKFIFTKHLSLILKLISDLGLRLDIKKQDIAHLDIQDILSLYSSLDYQNLNDLFLEKIKKNKELHKYTQAVKLPNLITDAKDIYNFFLENSEANYVTLGNIQAIPILEKNISSTDIENKIILIRSADPGYDYLFAKNIAGLITCYGGANSHMAIRCAELNIPAVIGCGENEFDKYEKTNFLEIDALNKQVRTLS